MTDISLVVDSGWAFADKEQTVMVRNVSGHGKAKGRGKAKGHARALGTCLQRAV